jgi:rod shape-determining protein MreC
MIISAYTKIKKNILLFGCFFLLCWFIAHRLLYRSPNISDYLASYFAYPIITMQRVTVKPMMAFFNHKKNVQKLVSQMHELQIERDRLFMENIELHATLDVHNSIAELVEFKQRYEVEKAQLAQIIMKHISDEEQFILVDVGSNKGIEKDMVAVWNNCLVGKVSQVWPWYSKVVLVTDSRCKVAVYGTDNQASGIHHGCNQQEVSSLEHVSHLSTIDVGELVISSGQGLVFPRGFAVGTVSACNPGQLFHEVTVKPLVDINDIEYCYVVKK